MVNRIIIIDYIKNNKVNMVGYTGVVFVMFAYLPLLYTMIVGNDYLAMSIYFLILNLISCILFIVYSYKIKDYPIMISNAIVTIGFIILINGWITENNKLKENDQNKDEN